MLWLTTDEHVEVVKRLIGLPAALSGCRVHKAGMEYTSLMTCFLMHSKGVAESLLALHSRFGEEWFPATTGYLVVRSLFEVDVNAHYISKDPVARSRRYIDYEHVIRKNTLDAIERHRVSEKSSWREGLQILYDQEYAPKKAKINADYDRVRPVFEAMKGKRSRSWSGKSLFEMAKEVDHVEAYDIFYADLSAFTHVNVMLANRFLRFGPDGIKWSQRANDYDVGHIFRYAAIFLTCFLEHFGNELSLWDGQKVRTCWGFPEANGRGPPR